MRAQTGVLLLLGLLSVCPVWGIGYVYTGVGGGGRELLELTSVEVDVEVRDRVAITRTDQVFSNRSAQVVEGIYEFALPSGAIITDLVLWIGEKRVQGLIMEKEEARRTYDDIVGRRIDPALVEQLDESRFRLSIFPFPAQGSRRVELEYTQVLEARGGVMEYLFPLAAETEQKIFMQRFVLRARLSSQHPFAVRAADPFQGITSIERPDDLRADIVFADEQVAAERDFVLTLSEEGDQRRPTLLSYAPEGSEMGYYALWLPPLGELTESDPLPRSITFIIDISSSMRGAKLAAVKGALTAAIEDLHAGDFFNIVVFSTQATAFVRKPVEASAENREAAMDFVRRQGALGTTNYEAALRLALGQRFPDGRLNHVVFLTDGHPTAGEVDLSRLSQKVGEWSGEAVRLFTIGVGNDINRAFLRALAEDHRGSSSYLAEEGDIEAELRALFEEFTRPIFLPRALVFEDMDVYDLYPNGVDLLASGQELFQVGRYEQGGAFALRLEGQVQNRQLVLEYPLEFSRGDRQQEVIPRLWAHQKVQALEGTIARFGAQKELLDDILDLGLTYRLVTRRTSLFAPDEEVVVNPQPEERLADGATAVEEELEVVSWLGRTFFLRDGVWVDRDFAPGMQVLDYDPRAGQPPELEAFARLGEELLVVAGDRAYQVRRGALPATPVLLTNAPNPFNAATLLRFQMPRAFESERVRLDIYNLAGQRVRALVDGPLASGAHQVGWDGRDETGREAATGIYLYRLEAGDFVASRRMLLLR